MRPVALLLIVLLLASGQLLAQPKRDTLQNPLNQAYYLKLSKTQKTQATVLVVTGGAATVVGGFIWFISPIAGITGSSESVKSAELAGKTILAGGICLTVVSIPLFHESKENKKKAELYMGSGQLFHPLETSREMLAVGLKIAL